MADKCETCRFALLVPNWRKRPRASRWEAAIEIYECRRLPMFHLKLPTDWCGEYQHKDYPHV